MVEGLGVGGVGFNIRVQGLSSFEEIRTSDFGSQMP